MVFHKIAHNTCIALFLRFLPNLCSKFAQLFSFKFFWGGCRPPCPPASYAYEYSCVHNSLLSSMSAHKAECNLRAVIKVDTKETSHRFSRKFPRNEDSAFLCYNVRALANQTTCYIPLILCFKKE